MKKLFESLGNLYYVEDFDGNPAPDDVAAIPFRVKAVVSYELRPYPQHPLRVDLYVANRPTGFTRDRLVLDNGVTLTGRAIGAWSRHSNRNGLNRTGFIRVEEPALVLGPDNRPIPRTDGQFDCQVDRLILGVVSSSPLGWNPLSNGCARPGFPFSFTTERDRLRLSSTRALRIALEEFEITLVDTSGYWKAHVDTHSLQHDSVIGLRRRDGGVLGWKQIERLTQLLSGFLGWVNHCVAPIFHIRGYYQGKLVCKGYNLQLQATAERDSFSWLPYHLPEKPTSGMHPSECVEDLLTRYVRTWEDNRNKRGLFHIALQLLRSNERGSPATRASVLYLQDAFVACGILLSIWKGKHERSRHNAIVKCLKAIEVEDQIPFDEWKRRLVDENAELWRNKKGRTAQGELGSSSRALANIALWQFHLYEAENARRLLNLPHDVQHYFVDVMTWLADLMILRVVGYDGWYFDRLYRETKRVPWSQA